MADKTASLLARLAPALRPRALAFINHLRASGVPVIITEGRRSKARQKALYASGRTRRGPILTNTLQSRHIQGLAFDIAFAGYSLDNIHPKSWAEIGQVGEQLGLHWGGRWKLRDYVHFEV